jgi:peptidoglycan/xylan/chitin deacetylase (PgdA/CDA1 family)
VKKLALGLAGTLVSLTLSAQTVPVLIYHRVNDLAPGPTVISPAVFEQHLDTIKSMGYTTVTISQLTRHMNGEIKLPEKSVAITLDDGWRDHVAPKLLADRNMAATFYIISGKMDGQLYFTPEEVKSLSNNYLFEIGAHTHTHFIEWEANLNKIDERVIVGEIAMSKFTLESVTGKKIESFSWPYGHVRHNLIGYIKDLGFTSTVMVTDEAKNDTGISAFTIQRLNIDGNCTADHLKQMITTRTTVDCK